MMTDTELIQHLDIDSMLYRLSKGEVISDVEIASLASFIEKNCVEAREKRSLEDLFAAVTFLKKLDNPKHSHLLGKMLNVHDPLIISLSIDVLVRSWNTFEDIQDQLPSFAVGVPFDHDGDVRESAIQAMAHVLLENLSMCDKTKDRYVRTLEGIADDAEADRYLAQLAAELLSEIVEAEKLRSKKLA